MTLSKNWVYTLYYNFKDEVGKKWAEARREEGLIYMKKTMERMSSFSVTAKEDNDSCLLLRGYTQLNNACTRDYIKKVLGRFSNCKAALPCDVLYLLKYFNINRDVTVTGELISGRNRHNANWVVKTALHGGDDFEVKTVKHGKSTEDNNTVNDDDTVQVANKQMEVKE